MSLMAQVLTFVFYSACKNKMAARHQLFGHSIWKHVLVGPQISVTCGRKESEIFSSAEYATHNKLSSISPCPYYYICLTNMLLFAKSLELCQAHTIIQVFNNNEWILDSLICIESNTHQSSRPQKKWNHLSWEISLWRDFWSIYYVDIKLFRDFFYVSLKLCLSRNLSVSFVWLFGIHRQK